MTAYFMRSQSCLAASLHCLAIGWELSACDCVWCWCIYFSHADRRLLLCPCLTRSRCGRFAWFRRLVRACVRACACVCLCLCAPLSVCKGIWSVRAPWRTNCEMSEEMRTRPCLILADIGKLGSTAWTMGLLLRSAPPRQCLLLLICGESIFNKCTVVI